MGVFQFQGRHQQALGLDGQERGNSCTYAEPTSGPITDWTDLRTVIGYQAMDRKSLSSADLMTAVLGAAAL